MIYLRRMFESLRAFVRGPQVWLCKQGGIESQRSLSLSWGGLKQSAKPAGCETRRLTGRPSPFQFLSANASHAAEPSPAGGKA
jgi:hypothetical protein